MRRQYHSRETENGRLTWDVHRLVELSQELPIIEIPLTEIRELDETFWFDTPSNLPTCRAISNHAKLIQETNLEFPIILCSEGRIMDGMHRVCKALMLEWETIKAKKFTVTPEPDYINVSVEELPYDEPW